MNSAIIQLIVLAAIAVFLILRLRSVLGTRDGFERPAMPVAPDTPTRPQPRIAAPLPGAKDEDITDHAPEGSPAALALAAMKRAEPGFHVGEFLRGARGAYEMILMAFQRGELDSVARFLAPEVAESFRGIIAERKAQGLTIDTTFVGIRELTLAGASFDEATKEGEISVRFQAELTTVAKNAAGEVVEGSPTEIRRQRDIWTFSRTMGAADPNWQLAATGE